MALDSLGLFDKVQSHAMSLGIFERVNTHEPKNAPGNGLSCAIWVDRVGPAIGHSSLTRTTVQIVMRVRLYSNMLQEPQDAIDPNILEAVDILLTAYSGDFSLGASVKAIDLLGMAGESLRAQAGYINQDGKMMRVMDVYLPILVNDAWEQVS